MRIVAGTSEHVEPWALLRAVLWPGESVAQHRRELIDTFLSGDARNAAFLAEIGGGDVVAFAEAALRGDYVNGCETSPVLFLEGIFVRPGHRRQGAARLLCAAVAEWGRAQGCREFASDALLDNVASHRFHAALGFEETERVVYFRKLL